MFARTHTHDSQSARKPGKLRLVAGTVAVAAIAAFTFGTGAVSAPAANAATGTTQVTACANRVTSSSGPLIISYWYNGSGWVAEQQLRTNGCATFTLQHNGYYHFMATSYAIVGCAEYVWGGASGVFSKQSRPSVSTMSFGLAYQRTIPLCG